MSQVQVGPPDLRTADPRAIALARYLRSHKLLKQRPSIFNGQRQDFFRVKRAIRALEDPAYEKARSTNPALPEAKTRPQQNEALKLLPLNRFAFNVNKVETQAALQKGLKPVSGVPCVTVAPEQKLDDDEYYMWLYNPVSVWTYAYGAGIVALIFGVVLFPLWPYQLRVLAWYVTMAAMGFVGFLLVLGVVRLILFGITYFTNSPGLWLFPNLFEDVGFFDSFRPLYSWHGQRTLPKKPKKKKRVKTEEQREAEKASLTQQEQQLRMQQMQQSPEFQALMQKAMQEVGARAGRRMQAIFEKEGPKEGAELEELKKKLLQEELEGVQTELQKAGVLPRESRIQMGPPQK